jgi:hypothetical protein
MERDYFRSDGSWAKLFDNIPTCLEAFLRQNVDSCRLRKQDHCKYLFCDPGKGAKSKYGSEARSRKSGLRASRGWMA